MDDNAEKLSQALSVILDRGWQINIRSDGNQVYLFDFVSSDSDLPLRLSIGVSRIELLQCISGVVLLHTLEDAACAIKWKLPGGTPVNTTQPINWTMPPGASLADLRARAEARANDRDARIAELEQLLAKAQDGWAEAVGIANDIQQCRGREGDSITILCDNPEADSADTQAAVEACASFTGWELKRFYGRTWEAALHKAADAARREYHEKEDGT